MGRISRMNIDKFLPNKVDDAHCDKMHAVCLHPFTTKLNGENDKESSALKKMIYNRTWEHLGFISSKDEHKLINAEKKKRRDAGEERLSKVYISATSYDVKYVQWFLRQYQRVNDRVHIYGLCKEGETFSENAPIMLSVKDEWFYLIAPQVMQEDTLPTIESLEHEFVLLPPLIRDDILSIEEVPEEELEIIDAVVDNIVETMTDEDVEVNLFLNEPTFNPITGEFE